MRTLMMSLTLLAAGAAAAAQDTAPAGRECLILLRNGDQVRGTLDKVAEGKLSVRPAMAPQSVMTVNGSVVASLTFSAAGGKGPATAETLRLRDGSRLRGRFLALAEGSVQFEFEGAALTFPLGEVQELAKAGAPPAGGDAEKPVSPAVRPPVPRPMPPRGRVILQGGNMEGGLEMVVDSSVRTVTPAAPEASAPPPATDRFVVVTADGDILTGTLRQQEDGSLLVSGRAVQASLAYPSVARISFPAPTSQPAPPSGLFSTVTTLAGSSVVGKDLQIDQGRMTLTLLGGQKVELPVEQLTALAFSASGALRDAVLVWGAYCDRESQFKPLVAAMAKQLGDKASLIENFDADVGNDFRAALLRSRAIVIPAMSTWRNVPGMPPGVIIDGPAEVVGRGVSAALQVGKFKAMAAEFLQEGGNIVLVDFQNEQLEFARQAGLIDTQTNSTTSGGAVYNFTAEGRALGKNVPDPFSAGNRTHNYVIGDNTPLATYMHGPPGTGAVLGHKVGRGWVILIGKNCAEDQQGLQILLNAIHFK